jgi:aconitate hydratase
VSIRIVLESVLRNCDGVKVTEKHVRDLANWQPNAARSEEIPFVGRPHPAAGLHRRAAARRPSPPCARPPPAPARTRRRWSRLAPVEMVVDHSVQVDVFGRPDALQENMRIEFERNRERYQFLKWGMQAFDTFKVVPPGRRIVHQVTWNTWPAASCRRWGSATPTHWWAPTATPP